MYASAGFHLEDEDVIRTHIESHSPELGGHYVSIEAGRFHVTFHASIDQIRELHNSIGESLSRLDSSE